MPNQGDEIVYYTVERSWPDHGGVRKHRVVYYENASYEDVSGDKSGRGVPFTNEWGVFRASVDGGWYLTGRVDEDVQAWLKRGDEPVYFNEREAQQAWLAACQKRIESISEELQCWRTALAEAEKPFYGQVVHE